MMAAGRAAERRLRVLLLEKNTVLGTKLLITGGGRCNVTNAISDRHILAGRYGDNSVHLHSLFARFTPEDTRTFLQRFGVSTRVEREGRVFPESNSARSVRDALVRYMEEGSVAIRTGRAVESLETRMTTAGLQEVTAVRTIRGERFPGRQIIVATGGTSRPDTGSTGDAYPWLQKLKLPVRPADTSLVPLRIHDPWVRRVQGLSLPDAVLHAEVAQHQPSSELPLHSHQLDWNNRRRLWNGRGKLLFTHFGFSGPLALNSATTVRDLADQHGAAMRLAVDVLPEMSREELHATVQQWSATAGKKRLATVLAGLIPPRLAGEALALAQIPRERTAAELTRKERTALVDTVKGMRCTFAGLLGSDKAVVSSGGLDPGAVDFATMRVRSVPSLMVLGDLLDFNRQSGGFSLQVCWSSGWVAGNACGAAEEIPPEGGTEGPMKL